MEWPDNADGDVFRRLVENGFDFEKEYDIDFNIDFDHWPLTEIEKEKISNLYPGCKFYDPDEEDIENGELIGYVQFQLRRKVTYTLVTETQDKVSEEMKNLGGWCESWGVMQE